MQGPVAVGEVAAAAAVGVGATVVGAAATVGGIAVGGIAVGGSGDAVGVACEPQAARNTITARLKNAGAFFII